MADERISEYTDDGTSHPIQSEDLLDFSNDTDGGTTYDVSKKILVSELATFFRNLFGLSISENIIPVGNAAGNGLKESTGKAGAVAGYPNALVIAQKDNHDDTNWGIWLDSIADGSATFIGSRTEIHMYTAGDQRLLSIAGELIEIAHETNSQQLRIGRNISSPTDSKVYISGRSTSDNSNAVHIVDSNEDTIAAFENSGLVFLRNGTGINEFSTDGTAAGNSDDAVMTEKAVKTYVDGLVAPQIIGGVTLSSSSNTNILNGTYVILADTTTVTSVTSGIGQDSNWTLEVTQAGITNQKGVVTFTGNLEKDAGGGANYDIAIFKNGSIVSESEQIDQKLESGGKGQSVTVMAITEFSTNDTFDIRVAGNGTADDIFCGGGSLYIQ
jgi:hypothetical protein